MPSEQTLTDAVNEASARIPLLWPLRHFVASNPFLGLTHMPFKEACAVLERVVGSAPVRTPAEYLAAFDAGEIDDEDLASVAGAEWTSQALVAVLEANRGYKGRAALPTVADHVDSAAPGARWGIFVTEEISKWCGVILDENQTTWGFPWAGKPLFEAWREAAMLDRNPEVHGLAGFRTFVASLPTDASKAIAACMERMAPPGIPAADFLHRQLATVSGWAGYVKYLVREDSLRGRTNGSLRDLLAIRLAYDCALFQAFCRDELAEKWMSQTPPEGDGRLIEALCLWQSAYEAGLQREIGRGLATSGAPKSVGRPSIQAVFCIDVRSEVIRRHLEAADPGAETIGFAGFFGFPVSHRLAGSDTKGSRCPALLIPPFDSCEVSSAEEEIQARSEHARSAAWKAFQNSVASCFSFVETAGLGFAASLRQIRPGATPSCTRAAPSFEHTPPAIESRASLAENALRNMGLTKRFARLVVICGHGSQSANNPYASGLDCGACGGHAGDVNARLAAATLNEPEVRAHLARRGITIPEDTVFLAALHNTTTDEVEVFDTEAVPVSHADDMAKLKRALAAASEATRVERSPSLGMDRRDREALADSLRTRAQDIAEVRPEWGLANNAALIAAPRARTSGLKLSGRVFLHDYDQAEDTNDSVLTLILSAPVVVASWISLQYYASRVDPSRYGAGNKVLHNISSGVGALEGNGGDLRCGLPLQSIHDGTSFVHEPRRLTVYIEARPERIGSVLSEKPDVAQLFDNEWIHLVAIDGESLYRYVRGIWAPMGLHA
jgi:hypothetical protein